MASNHLKTRITADASQFNRVVGRLGKTVGRAATGLAGAGVAAAAFSIREAVNFEKKMAEVFTLLGNPPPELRTKLTNDIRRMSVEFGQAKGELATGLYATLSAGIPPGNAIDFLTTGVKTAVASVTDTETAIKGLVGIINAYRLSSDDAEMVSDKLFTTVKLGSTNYALMADSLGKSNSAANALGVGLDEMLASFVAIVGTEMDTARATTMLGAVMSSLANPSEKLAARFKALGVASAEDLIQTHGLVGGLRLLTKTTGTSLSEITQLFGERRAASGIIALLMERRLPKYMAEIGTAAGGQGVAFDIMAATSAMALARMKQDFLLTAEKMGTTLLPALGELSTALQETLNDPDVQKGIKSMFSGIGTAIKDLAEVLNATVDLFSKLAEIGKDVEDAINPPIPSAGPGENLNQGGLTDWIRRVKQNTRLPGHLGFLTEATDTSRASGLNEPATELDLLYQSRLRMRNIQTAVATGEATAGITHGLGGMWEIDPATMMNLQTTAAAAPAVTMERIAVAAEKTATISDKRLPPNWGQ
jgi:TP901 family phage tail tape measure protein